MYCPEIFRDGNLETKHRIIIYLSHAHKYKFMDVGNSIRIKCPDLFTTYHYDFTSKYLLHLTNKEGKKIYNRSPIRTEGFLSALCEYILPTHTPSVIYNVSKIPFLISLAW